MQPLIKAFSDTISLLTGNPSSKAEMMTIIILALMVGLFTIMKTGKALKFAMPEPARTMTVTAIWIFLGLIAACAVQIYALPHLPSAAWTGYLPITAAVLISFAAVVPSACFLFKSRYFPTVFAMMMGLIAAVVVVFVVQAAADAITHGNKGFTGTKDRTENINDMIKK
jgi:hypothetical protein